ncbi:MAG: glycine cleavage system aminomethyltransferase GcvT [Chromatiaceae bacterium]|nr:glycine cleavage system aminomethyltransferase GcvT [Chromatiaceae bacterium]
MGHRTPLFAEHQRLGARIVPFGGWDMPLHYGSQIEEHLAVRNRAGLFDVSHMRALDISGTGARDFLRRLLANDVARLREPGKALYSCMLNEAGGVLDDLIVYFRGPERYRLVVNAGTADQDLAWIETQAQGREVAIRPRTDLAMIAVQGPEARRLAAPRLPPDLREPALALAPFFGVGDEDWFVARTGYTGEDGFEILLPADQAAVLWQGLVTDGVVPCGLGARDTLRLEAGMNLYGQDMDEDTSPLEAGLDWTLAWEPAERDFIGRAALEARRAAGGPGRFVGLLLTGRGVLRAHQRVLVEGRAAGIITSGGYAPSLQRSIALARLAPGIALASGDPCEVDIRGKPTAARLVQPPFVRHGTIRIDLD